MRHDLLSYRHAWCGGELSYRGRITETWWPCSENRDLMYGGIPSVTEQAGVRLLCMEDFRSVEAIECAMRGLKDDIAIAPIVGMNALDTTCFCTMWQR